MGTKVRYLSSTYLLNIVWEFEGLYIVKYSSCYNHKKIYIYMFICMLIKVSDIEHILIIGSKRYIVSHEGDHTVMKQMRIEKVEKIPNPSGNIKFW